MGNLDDLYDAAIAGDVDAIAALEKETGKEDPYYGTILHIESLEGNEERVRFILREFANKNLLTKFTRSGTSALHWAVFGKHTEVAKVIIEAAKKQLPETSFRDFLRLANQEKNTALHYAVSNANLEIVEVIVENDPTGKYLPNTDGKTPIYIAAEIAHTNIVKVICTTCKTAPLNLDGPGGSTALLAAVKNHNQGIEVLQVLIDTARGVPPSSSVSSFQSFLRRGDEDENTALHLAVMQGKLDSAKLLVESDPSYPGTKNKKGKTPFYIAAEKGHADIAKMICTTCTAAPFNYLDGPGGRPTALHAVVKNLDEGKNEVKDMIKIIIDVFKTMFISKDPTASKYSMYKEFDKIIFTTDEYGQTILELAVELNYVGVVEVILEVINPTYDSHGEDFISLKSLIYKAKDKHYDSMIKVLVGMYEAGADASYFSFFDQSTYDDHDTFISAIESRDTKKVFLELDGNAHALVTFVDKFGWTALHHAAYHEFDLIVERLIEEQESSKHKFVYQDMVSTPFHISAERGYTTTVIHLMQKWPSFSSAYIAVDRNAQNILHLAALQNNKEMIQGILEYCPDTHRKQFMNQQDKDGNTPLHILIRNGCFIRQIMRYEGLDLSVQNKEKFTPPDMLYFEIKITNEDQVKIKVALDYIQFDKKIDFFLKSELTPSVREKKDVKFRKEKQQMTDGKLALMKGDTHAIAKCLADAIAGDPISRAALEMEADKRNQEGETILHVESKKGVLENVRFITSAFANKNLLDMLDNKNQTALYLAADRGHTQVVKALLDAASCNWPSTSAHNPVGSFQAFIRHTGPMQNTALHLAVLKRNVAIVKLIVEVDPNDSHVKNNEGKTPIYIAAENGYKDIIEEICTTCTALSLDGPRGNMTALHALIQKTCQATEENRHAIWMMINAAKHSSSAENAPHLSFEALFTRIDELGRTVLELAVEKSNVHAVDIILKQDPAYESGRGSKNHLMHLIYEAIDDKRGIDIVKLLSEAYEIGMDTVHKGVLDLILAIKERDSVQVLQLLRSKEKLVTFADDEGWTPLHYAVKEQLVSVLQAIIKAPNNEFVYSHSTPFHVAAKYGYDSCITELMKSWQKSSSAYLAIDKTGQNVLHLAAARKNKNMIQEILVSFPQVHMKKLLEQKDQDGNTPLHLLIYNECCVPELINYKGLDLMAKNNKRWTPRDLLYLEDGISDEQVQIKVALDHAQTNQHRKFWEVWKFWQKGTEKDRDIFESIVLPNRRQTKDGLLNICRNQMMDKSNAEMRKRVETYKDRTNTQIVVAALITTVTFTVGFTMPGGLHQSGEVDEGLVVLSKRTAFNAFMVTDALALLLSTSSLFFYFLQSIYKDHHQVARLNAAATGLNIVSITAMMVTFITGTYVVLYNSPALAITVCIIASLFFILVIVLLIKLVCDRGVKTNAD